MSNFVRKHPPELIEQLRVLWTQGRSLNEISEMMGMSRNTVIGIIHRNGFPRRKSPIKRAVPSTNRVKSERGCCWPMWPHAARPTYEYCGAPPVAPGRPYCPEHDALAHTVTTLKPRMAS